MDTRTPRTPSGDRSSGFDDAPALSMVKVPCDPAQVIVAHASFRVRLPAVQRTQLPRITRHVNALGPSRADASTTRIPVITAAGTPGARRRPVVMSGGDLAASGLLQTARRVGDADADQSAGATQVLPRVGDGDLGDELGLYADESRADGARTEGARTEGARILPHMRQAGSAFEETSELDRVQYVGDADGDDGDDEDGTDAGPQTPAARRYGPVRHAYFPDRRMNLGVVLLPLRVFLGFISIYAGMGKLCDPVYFDGGERGSMVKWLNSLHPWQLAEPLRDWALQHPVGAGLAIAFLQVVVGVLTVLGLWQRLAASVGALLSAALLVTVSWKTVPAYDAPDIIYLAAWSPLIIAGAPVYSFDGRFASGAWRRLGPRATLWELRRYVLRRGTVLATLVIGCTLLIGSLLGGAVRDADRVTVPGPGEAPRNELPGSPLPSEPGHHHRHASSSPSAARTPTQGTTASPSDTPSAARRTAGGSTSGPGTTTPTTTQGATTGAPQQSSPQRPPSSSSAGPTSSGGTSSAGTSTTGGSGGSTSGGGDTKGLVGGLLGG
ncbi:DoxX family membrane protein [Streptomyces beihaiensis]|uniref:DoxX family membrane protein n=1 Tax=Streptomyces beihaiensis TaxID=2984495 RepID=A0ABT3TX01_9ACTN|nr:DoxX family membrane protein [Streptomyces beihaiensis]MCX3061578.1 DoxX family membrane protein [Streptomyces beihaiensis]